MPASGLIITPVRHADIAAIERIEELCFLGDRLSHRSLRRLIGRPSAEWAAARAGGVLIGYALVLFRSGAYAARLYSLAVDPEHAGVGAGTELLRAAERKAAARGALMLRLEVRADNAAAISLYRKLGYRNFGRRMAYYDDGADALRFEKRLPPVATG